MQRNTRSARRVASKDSMRKANGNGMIRPEAKTRTTTRRTLSDQADSTDIPADEETDVLSTDDGARRADHQSLDRFSARHDPTTVWFYNPRSLSIFGVACATMASLAYYTDRLHLPERIRSNLGVFTACASFLIFCMLTGRDGPFRRPHPAFWRAVLGLNMLYWSFLCFLFFHDKEYARTVAMPYFDPNLGKPVEFRAFDENCDLTWQNFKGQALEIFSLAHALGWFGKALILRDWWLLNILSVVYELVEYSLMHQIPEFHECWWDHALLDVCGCNFIGSLIGMQLCKKLNVSHLSWRGIRSRQSGFRNTGAAMVEQLTPFDFADFNWEGTKRFRNYLSTILLLVIFLMSEVDIFYLKHLLWVPSTHPMVTIRLVFIFLWALPATRELYEYVNYSRRIKRMGLHVWLLVATVLLEFLIVVKWSQGEFTTPTPKVVIVLWSCAALFLAIYPAYRFGLPAYRRRRDGSRAHKRASSAAVSS